MLSLPVYKNDVLYSVAMLSQLTYLHLDEWHVHEKDEMGFLAELPLLNVSPFL